MSKHTKGLIYAGCEDDPKSGDIYADDGSLIAECFVNGKPKTREANARRLAACWNACNGISTKTLESCYGERGGIMKPLIPIQEQAPQRRSPAKSDRAKASCLKCAHCQCRPDHSLLVYESDPYLAAVVHTCDVNLTLDRARNLRRALLCQNQKVPGLVTKAGHLIKKVVGLIFRQGNHRPSHRAPR